MKSSPVTDLYELTMAQVYFKNKRDALATFDLFIRSEKRPFYVACGIDDALTALENFRFGADDIDYLKSLGLFEDDFLSYLKEFRFKGEVWALEEPEIVFASEPILRVTSNIIEAQIVESILLNKVNLGITLATKALRIVLSAKGRGVYDFSLRRTQGVEASLACAKYSYIAGVKGTSNVYAGFLYRIPVAGTMAHSFVMSFNKEIDSFIAFSRQFPAKSILLVDTYDTRSGIDKAVSVAKDLKKAGFNLLGIRLDSGDLASDSRYARYQMDKEGLIDTVIFASGNLDEYKIDSLVKKNAPIDAFGVGTNMGCSSDEPYTDVIYKLVEIKDKSKDFIPTMKLGGSKTTLPGRKQVYRVFGSDGTMKEDYICVDKEKIQGKKLLRKVISGGKRIIKEKTLDRKREIMFDKIKCLPEAARSINDIEFKYPVLTSGNLMKLTDAVKKQIAFRIAKKIVFLDIDTQFDFLYKEGALYVKNSKSVIKNIEKLTKFASENNIPIISSQDTHHKNDIEFKSFPPHCIKGTKGNKKLKGTLLRKHKVISSRSRYTEDEISKIVSEYPQIILEKNVLGVFSNVNALNIIEGFYPEEIYVYGVATEYCVKEAVEGLIKHGFSAVVIEDAVKEISHIEKEKIFSLWKKKGVRFIDTKSLLRKLRIS